MAKRPRKAPLTDPSSDALNETERATSDEAEILREIEQSDRAPAAAKRGNRKAAGKKPPPVRKPGKK
jgi:hypothetical protein